MFDHRGLVLQLDLNFSQPLFSHSRNNIVNTSRNVSIAAKHSNTKTSQKGSLVTESWVKVVYQHCLV